MEQLPVSVVVVSRGRPDSLRLTLLGLARLHHSNYEVIVVADPAGLTAARGLPFADHLRLIPCDVANISAARNLGISASGGEIVAFIDDDAVPEPAWLAHLGAAFHDRAVAAAGGFVIGRNGISYQWTARSIGPDGRASALSVDRARPTVLTGHPGHAIKTEGTNMAVRRWVLKKLGGFDENFRFYLDETDLNMRLAQHGYATAIVPLAVVHHAYAPSPRRRRDRAALDLFDIGRSSALFWRKHTPKHDWPRSRAALITEQRRRVLTQMRDGLLEPGAARHALLSLDRGLQEGSIAPPVPQTQIARRQEGIQRFPTLAVAGPVTLSAGMFGRAAVRRQARALAAQGRTVSVYFLSKTAVFHTVVFCQDGYWLQKGGLYGKSDRQSRWFRFFSRASRVTLEQSRVERVRHFSPFIGQQDGVAVNSAEIKR